MKFRPCLDLYQGNVCLIVGHDQMSNNATKVSFSAKHEPSWYAKLYKKYKLQDGHLFMIGKGNEKSCLQALSSYPATFRVGGNITINNCHYWLDNGAKAVIITSFFDADGFIDWRLLTKFKTLLKKSLIILGLSTADLAGQYPLFSADWQKPNNVSITIELLAKLTDYCSGLVIHSIDRTGCRLGIDKKLLNLISGYLKLPIVYAGGVSTQNDLNYINKIGKGQIDFSVGHALDIFDGSSLKISELAKQYS